MPLLINLHKFRPKATHRHDISSFEGRRKLGRNAMVDAAIARLRGPPPQTTSGSLRQPAKSTYGLSLASADEFYAHTGMSAGPAATASPNSQPIANNTSQPTRLGNSVVNMRAVDTISTASAKAAKPVFVLDSTSSSLKSIGNKPLSTTIPIAYGQTGLAGSRWATPAPQGVGPSADGKNIISAVSISTTGSAIIPPTINEVPDGLKFQFSGMIILRSFDGVKISSDSFPEAVGIVRLVTSLRDPFASLEILVNKVLILNEALYMSDTFTEDSGALKFQPYSQKGQSLIWKMVFPLPYQSTVLTDTAKGQRRNEPRPIQELPLNGPELASPRKELSNVEALVNSHLVPNLPMPQRRDMSNPGSAEATLGDDQLLIDFNADEATSRYISPTLQVLMSLMTDDACITNLLNRLNLPTGRAFLDRVFSITGQPPTEGYSPQMLVVAKNLVLELYTQSDTFHKLPWHTTESLVDETTPKLLEKALSIWRAQVVDTVQSSQPDEGPAARSNCRPYVYSDVGLLSLRSHATTIEGRLIPEYDMLSTRLKANASSKPSSRSEDSCYVRSRGASLTGGPVAPVSPTKSSAVPIPPLNSMSPAMANAPTTLQATGDCTYQIQRVSVFGVIQSDLEFQRQSSLDSRRSHNNKNSSSSAESHNTKDNGTAAGPIKRHILDGFKSEEHHLSPRDLDQKSDSTECDLLTKFGQLNLDHIPSPPTSALVTSAANVKGESEPSALPVDRGNSRSPFPEINNCDLKGSPGLAASMWAQGNSQSSAISQLRKARFSLSPPTPIPFPGGIPSYQVPLIPLVPALFPIPSVFVTPHRPSKPRCSSPLNGDALSFSPESSVRPPLSPIRRENSQIQGQRNPGPSPYNRQ